MKNLSINEALKIAENKYKPRFNHILGVYEKAEYLADKYAVDSYKCSIAAILHDYAKFESKNLMLDVISIYEPSLVSYDGAVYHGYVGAYLVQKEFGINDVDIINAIKYHVTGHPEMNDIAKIVYVADYTEKGRTHKGVEFCRYLSEKSLDLAVLGCAEGTYDYLISKKQANIHPLTKSTYETYLKKVGGNVYDTIKDNYKSMR